MHLAHPLGVKGFAYRRVKNDIRDACDLADLLRMGRLPESWIAPPETRELREMVRYRAKLVALRSGLKAQVHGVLAKAGVLIAVSDLFGVDGRARMAQIPVPGAYAQRVTSLLHLIDILDAEEAAFNARIAQRLRGHMGCAAIRWLPGIGEVLAAVLVAEIGDVTRFASADGSDRIDCDDLLIGLAGVGRGVAAAVLTDAGFDPATPDPAPADT